jgi:hypothetical protein
MPVISIQDISGGGGQADDKGNWSYKRRLRLITNSVADGPVTILNTAGVPRPYDPYVTPSEYDFGALCKNVEPTQDPDNPYLWHVEAEYSTDTELAAWYNKDPLQRPSRTSWSTERFRKAMEKDETGAAVVNSASDPFDPPIEKDGTILVVTIERNEATFDPSLPVTYQDATNSDIWLGYAVGNCKVESIGADEHWEDNTHYYAVRYVIHVRGDGWLESVLDAGYSAYTTVGVKAPITDLAGRPYSSPQLLDGTGHVLPVNGNPVYINFAKYPSLPYANLNIP